VTIKIKSFCPHTRILNTHECFLSERDKISTSTTICLSFHYKTYYHQMLSLKIRIRDHTNDILLQANRMKTIDESLPYYNDFEIKSFFVSHSKTSHSST